MEIKGELIAEELKKANISLILESYQDIFSSFDPRGFLEKSLSDDFLLECRRAARDKDDKSMEIILSLPRAKRNLNDEFKIKKRLKEHFHKHFLENEKELTSIKRTGIFLIFSGMILMFFSFLLYSTLSSLNEIFRSILLVITEPGGWFLFWIGGEKFIYEAKEKTPDYIFYKKMANAEINFRSY